MNQGTEWGLLMKKNRSKKSRASVPLSKLDCIYLSISMYICVRDGAGFKNKLMGVMVYFYPAKINTNQYYESVSLSAGNNNTIRECMTI
jgi:hypothetical protein